MGGDDELTRDLVRVWDAGADGYDATPRHGLLHSDEWAAWRRLVAAILGDPTHAGVPRLRVLDAGTGTGFLALLAAELGHEVTGVDLSEQMLNRARKKARAAGLAIDWRIGDAAAPPVEGEPYDAVICRHLAWTLPHPERALRAWCDALRPGGLIAVVDGWVPRRPAPVALAEAAARRIVQRRRRTSDHGYRPEIYARLPLGRQRDTAGIVRLLREAGLERVRVRRLHEVDRVERAHLGPLERIADPWRLYLAVGRVPAAERPE